jgi:hypothetical protein
VADDASLCFPIVVSIHLIPPPSMSSFVTLG